jgi:hypothetical protein
MNDDASLPWYVTALMVVLVGFFFVSLCAGMCSFASFHGARDEQDRAIAAGVAERTGSVFRYISPEELQRDRPRPADSAPMRRIE